MGNVIVVTGGKGGVGKTTIALNTCKQLSKLHKKVLLIDADFGLRKLDLLMNLQNWVTYDIDDVINSRCDSNDAIIRCDGYPNLYLLPGSQNVGADAVSIEDFNCMVNMYKRDFDYVVIDCPAGVDSGFKLAIVAADTALVVVGQDICAIRDVNKVIELLKLNKIDYKLVMNRISPKLVQSGNAFTVADIEHAFSREVFAIVPDDETIIKSANTGMEPNGISKHHFMNIADRLVFPLTPRLEMKVSKFESIKRAFSRYKVASL